MTVSAPRRLCFWAFAARVAPAVVLIAGAAGCDLDPVPDTPTVPLAQLPSPSLSGEGGRFTLDYDTSKGCFSLPEGASATVNGVAAKITGRGEYRRVHCVDVCDDYQERDGELHCERPTFVADTPPADNAPLVVEVSDGATTFRARMRGNEKVDVLAPTGLWSGGEDLSLLATFPAQYIVEKKLSTADGDQAPGPGIGPSKVDPNGGMVTYPLEGGCSSTGSSETSEAYFTVSFRMVADSLEGGLTSPRIITRTEPRKVTVMLLPAEQCR